MPALLHRDCSSRAAHRNPSFDGSPFSEVLDSGIGISELWQADIYGKDVLQSTRAAQLSRCDDSNLHEFIVHAWRSVFLLIGVFSCAGIELPWPVSISERTASIRLGNANKPARKLSCQWFRAVTSGIDFHGNPRCQLVVAWKRVFMTNHKSCCSPESSSVQGSNILNSPV